MKDELERLRGSYFDILQQLVFDEKDLDYPWFNLQVPFLEELAKLNRSALSVFDLHRKSHLFASENFDDLFSLSVEDAKSHQSLHELVPLEDQVILHEIAIKMMQLYGEIPHDELGYYKLINEYRVVVPGGSFIRVIEQHKSFKTDAKGKIWLALSMVDISPNQNSGIQVLSQVVNTKNGATFSLLNQENLPVLTKRESQIFNLVSRGMLSKEISDQLNISVHTVNTHRQRILEKMNANNSIEAIEVGQRFGLI
ncbi:MAG: LuxR family transcriptional regulator [Saprospiraceae bacterium]|nr:LuxR family transcriptional regulator [Saprospiraceae bacterium]